MGQWIDLKAADGFTFSAYVAQPAGRPKAGLVVLQEIFGVNSHIRAVADGYAADGYLAVAPSMFQRVKPGVDLGYTPDDMSAGSALKAAVEALPAPGAMADVQAAVNHAASAGKVGVVGYCWGGLLTWRAAALVDGVSAAVPYYGGGMTAGAEVQRHPRCPVLCHFGERDRHITLESVQAFARAQHGVRVEVYAADHGFNCDQRASYDATASAVARTRTLAFFGQHLG